MSESKPLEQGLEEALSWSDFLANLFKFQPLRVPSDDERRIMAFASAVRRLQARVGELEKETSKAMISQAYWERAFKDEERAHSATRKELAEVKEENALVAEANSRLVRHDADMRDAHGDCSDCKRVLEAESSLRECREELAKVKAERNEAVDKLNLYADVNTPKEEREAIQAKLSRADTLATAVEKNIAEANKRGDYKDLVKSREELKDALAAYRKEGL